MLSDVPLMSFIAFLIPIVASYRDHSHKWQAPVTNTFSASREKLMRIPLIESENSTKCIIQ